MEGRHQTHKKSTRRPLVFAVLTVLVATAVVLTALVIRDQNAPAAAGCGRRSTVTVSVTPEMEGLVDAAGERVADRQCVDFDVSPQQSAVAASAIGSKESRPDLWLPDASLWAARAAAVKGGAPKPQVLAASVVSSPTVVVSRRARSEEPSTWLSALTSKDLRLGDVLTSASAALPIVAAQLEAPKSAAAQEKVTSSFVSLAQRSGADTQAPIDDAERLREVSQFGGTAIVSEQAFVNGTGRTGANIVAAAPATGTAMLDYPLYAVTPSAPTERAGKALVAELVGKAGARAAAAVGFRDSDSDALAENRGIGNVRDLDVEQSPLLEPTLTKWAKLALPTRTLAVIDVSGSMLARQGGETRIELTVQAALTGIGVFPSSASLGMWAFSDKLGPGGRDYKQLAPIEKLESRDGSVSHRTRLQQVATTLPSLVGGGTALYDTALASFREVARNYDPDAVNSVILLSDGKNEDSASIGLDTLLSTLRTEQDKSRPVVIISIGIGSGADTAVLKKISAATGGTNYTADTPQDIPNVFVKALQSRIDR